MKRVEIYRKREKTLYIKSGRQCQRKKNRPKYPNNAARLSNSDVKLLTNEFLAVSPQLLCILQISRVLQSL